MTTKKRFLCVALAFATAAALYAQFALAAGKSPKGGEAATKRATAKYGYASGADQVLSAVYDSSTNALRVEGAPGGNSGSSVSLQTNGVANGSQSVLNLQNGSGITLTNAAGTGNVTIGFNGILPANQAAAAHTWLSGYNAATGAFTASQPSFLDLSGTLSAAQLPAGVPAFSGTITAGDCAKWLSSGVLADAGAACGSGGSSITLAGDLSGTMTSQIVVGLQNHFVSSAAPSTGQVLEWNTAANAWTPTSLPAFGSVTSVGLSLPASLFSVSGSPVSTSGTLTAALASQSANLVFASPSGSSGTPGFRALNIADLPAINFTNLTGSLSDAQLPADASKFTGTITAGDCAKWSSSGVLADAGAACGTGGSSITLAGDLSGTMTSQIVVGLQNHFVSSTAPSSGQVLEWNTAANAWTPTSLPAFGTVTSVGLSLPASLFSVSSSPVSTSGTLTGTLASQNANLVFAGPSSGSASAPTFRALTAADIPALSYQAPLSTYTAPANEFLTGFTAPNTFTAAQPSFANLSGTAAAAQIPNPAGDVTGTYAATTVTGLHFGSTGIALGTAPASGQCLEYNGTNITGTACAGGGSGSPGGANTQIQFNNSGAFSGSANFTWNNTNQTLAENGTFTVSGLLNPPSPVLSISGTAGTTSYSYAVVAEQGSATTAEGAAATITTGNAALSATNYNIITTPSVAGATACDIYRTASGGSPSTTGKIGTVSCGSALNDTGLTASGSAPASNGTGTIMAANFVTSGAGAGFTEWTSGPLSQGVSGTVLCGANSNNYLACSFNGGALALMPALANDLGGTDPTNPQVVGFHLTSEGETGDAPVTFSVQNDVVIGTTQNDLAILATQGVGTNAAASASAGVVTQHLNSASGFSVGSTIYVRGCSDTTFDTVPGSPMTVASVSGSAITYNQSGTGASATGCEVALTGNPQVAVAFGANDSNVPAYLVASTTATSGNARLVTAGSVGSCAFDGASTVGDYVVASSTTLGECHDAGASAPSSLYVVGQVYSAASGAGVTGLVKTLGYSAGGSGGGSGSGTVTSVGLSLPSIFNVSGSPVTAAGTLTGTLATESANSVFAGPSSGSAAAPAFRALAAADIPAPAGDVSGTYAATTVTGLHFGSTGLALGTVPSTGQCLEYNGTNITGAACAGGSSGWSSLTGATANVSLSNSTYNTTFNQTTGSAAWLWANTTAATSTVAQTSPQICLAGNNWTGSGASTADEWCIQDQPANGLNTSDALAFTHTTSSASGYGNEIDFPGIQMVYVPGSKTIFSGTQPSPVWLASPGSQPVVLAPNDSAVLSALTSGAIQLNSANAQIQTARANSDISGTIVLTSQTSNSVTFPAPYGSAPACTITPTSDPTAVGVWWVTTSTTAVTANVKTAGTITFNYVCVGNPN